MLGQTLPLWQQRWSGTSILSVSLTHHTYLTSPLVTSISLSHWQYVPVQWSARSSAWVTCIEHRGDHVEKWWSCTERICSNLTCKKNCFHLTHPRIFWLLCSLYIQIYASYEHLTVVTLHTKTVISLSWNSLWNLNISHCSQKFSKAHCTDPLKLSLSWPVSSDLF
jgi:hypothetical protein